MKYLEQLLLSLEELRVSQEIISQVLYWYYVCSSNLGLQHEWHSVAFALNYGIPPSMKPLSQETLAYKLSRAS
jgi:hypothetical protein